MIDKNSKISFVIPAYNCADTIIESVESIFNGNFEDGDEVIIVNDGSTDDTFAVINDLKKKYPVIKIINNSSNVGCPASRNIGIRSAKSDLIFNLDSDNILEIKSITKLKTYLTDKGADLAGFSQYHYFKKNIKAVTHKWIYPKDIMSLADFLSGPINPGPGGNFLYTKESWEKIGGYWEYGKGLHEAWGFTLKQLASGSRFMVLPDSYYFHRYGIDSLFIRESKKQNESNAMATKMIINIIDLINDKDADYIKSEEGSKTWFDNIASKPIRLKNNEIGITGFKITLKQKTSIINVVKSVTPDFLLTVLKKMYLFIVFLKDYFYFKKSSLIKNRFNILWRNNKIMLFDKTTSTHFDTHYIYHPAWAVRIVKKINPKFHVDISSTLTFSSILSAFIPVHFYDYRPANLKLLNLISEKADLHNLPFENMSIDSLSCMHTIEHIGLGRYGEPIDPDGDLKAISELKRILAINGNLLFVAPIGKPKIVFNAHRIYSYDQIMDYFSDLTLQEFSLIPDNALQTGIIHNATKSESDLQNYGCGLFWFIKKI